ncbi:hypothetical protein Poli38472_014670 [Pythium oligandrum]|uniref:Transmembrane protein n=1 Tax=Pythium oligandrum TaxID=41045 RepID=A0A8K1CJS7_PYTOL|nr:hypothetical protein Poli38472_014670 [Pythium oligandrum]|eukprot:TMW63965.1 hypothetical protein Poli38472_014670 [Pythium oligandrum]
MTELYRPPQKPLRLDYALGHSPSHARTDELEYPSTAHAYLPQSSRERSTEGFTTRGRFVAGEAFFNYDAMGGLREGLAPVELLSSSYCGLLINGVVAGFAIIFFQCVFQQLLVADFTTHHQEQINAAKYLLLWPGAFSVFIGVLSDSLPMFGSRRKSYMILGWIISCLMFGAMVVVCYVTSSNSATRGYLLLIFSVFAAFGMQIAYIASLAMTIELAQREHLYQRGHLQSLYLVWYFAFSTIAQLVASFVLLRSDDGATVTASVDLSASSAILAGISLVPIPFLLFCLEEEHAERSRVAFFRRISELWQLLQWKVVYKMLFFLCGSVFFSAASDTNVSTAIMVWSKVSMSKIRWIYLGQIGAKFLAALLWKAFFVNYSWRRLAFIALIVNVVANVILAIPTVYNLVRNEWYMYVWSLIADVPFGLFELFALIAPTEIADVGREGAVIGLVNSFTVLITIATYTLWESVSEAVGLEVNVPGIMMDSADTRTDVMVTGTVYIIINLVGVCTAFFMPNQKLDAQQLRAFGGYNRLARMLLVGAFLLLLTYDLVANILKIAN